MFAALLLAPLLVFHGNVALLDDVYRSFLDLPANTRATEETARQVAIRVSRFLHRAGYGLATVRAHVQGEQIALQIDEGRLDKVIFLGGGAFETLRLRLELHIQQDVFNRYELERQLRDLAKRMGLSEFAYEIVPVAGAPAHVQAEDIDPIEKYSFGMVRPGRPYELHILVQPGVFRPGLSPELEIDSAEGGGLGLTWHDGRLFFADDRWQVSGRAAGALRQRLDGTGSDVSFTRALGEAEYDAPSIAGVVRPSLRARADLSDRQRPDLGLESFMFTTLDAAAQILFAPLPHLSASLAAGVERRLLYSVEPGPAAVFGPSYRFAQTRQYGEASTHAEFRPRVAAARPPSPALGGCARLCRSARGRDAHPAPFRLLPEDVHPRVGRALGGAARHVAHRRGALSRGGIRSAVRCCAGPSAPSTRAGTRASSWSTGTRWSGTSSRSASSTISPASA